jgi:hypothetical protein
MTVSRSVQAAAQPLGPQPEWLSLTDLGRLHGISAVHCGRLLSEAGLRRSDGRPSRLALHRSLAQPIGGHRHHRGALWHRAGCTAVLERQGVSLLGRHRLIEQWADLLETLGGGIAAVSTSAEEMAQELPGDLIAPVNRALRQRGSSFQVRRAQARRRASACLAACSSNARS